FSSCRSFAQAAPPTGVSSPSLHDALPISREFMSDTTVDCLFEHAIRRKVAQYGHLEGRAAGVAILRDLLEYAPHMVFLMLPLYRSEEHTSELQSRENLVGRLLLEKKNRQK